MAENTQFENQDIYYCAVCCARATSKEALKHTTYRKVDAVVYRQCGEYMEPIRIKSGTYLAHPDGRITCKTCGLSGGTLRILSCLPSCASYGTAVSDGYSYLRSVPRSYGEMEQNVEMSRGAKYSGLMEERSAAMSETPSND